MHILIFPSWYFRPGTSEIAGRMFLHQAQGLRDAGVDARIFYPNYSMRGPFFKTASMNREEGVPTWRINQWAWPKANSFLYKRWIHACVKDVEHYVLEQGKPDVIHAQSYPAAAVTAELVRKLKIPYIYTERLSSLMTGVFPSFHTEVIKNSIAPASMITAVSPGLQERMQSFTDKKVEVIPNFYDGSVFYPDPKVEKQKIFTFVSVGEPAHIKGLDLLLHAFAAVKRKIHPSPLQLILVDRIKEETQLRKLALQLDIDKQIRWTGLISQQEMAQIFRKSHVLVSASRVETFGKAIAEAQACGLPVVATRTSGAAYILKSADQGILVALEDVNALANAMEQSYQSIHRYHPDQIIAQVENRFSRQVVIQQWINMYKTIAR